MSKKELSFGKNGKVLGRVKVGSQNNSAWTENEDAFLRKAIAEGKTTQFISERLGRSIASLATRKWKLCIPGRFKNSPRGTSRNLTHQDATPVPVPVSAPVSEVKSTVTFGKGVLELESNVPIPTRSSKNDEVRIKLSDLFKAMKPNQSFVVPKNLHHVALHVAKKEFESYKIKSAATTGDKKFYRIFRVI